MFAAAFQPILFSVRLRSRSRPACQASRLRRLMLYQPQTSVIALALALSQDVRPWHFPRGSPVISVCYDDAKLFLRREGCQEKNKKSSREPKWLAIPPPAAGKPGATGCCKSIRPATALQTSART